jgi:hypothetical protein
MRRGRPRRLVQAITLEGRSRVERTKRRRAIRAKIQQRAQRCGWMAASDAASRGRKIGAPAVLVQPRIRPRVACSASTTRWALEAVATTRSPAPRRSPASFAPCVKKVCEEEAEKSECRVKILALSKNDRTLEIFLPHRRKWCAIY